jgi:putative membrane protein
MKLVAQILAGILGLWLAEKFIAGVSFHGNWQVLFCAGAILGLLNSFVKPIIKLISLPLRIITLGFFSIIINMTMVWGVDMLFPELEIKGTFPLFWTSIIVWLSGFILTKWLPKK